MKKSSLLWIFLVVAGFAIVEMRGVMANKPDPTPAQATAKAPPSRMTVDQANALVAESNQESKESTRLMKRWDAETNASTDIEDLQKIEMRESPTLDQAVMRNNHANELMSQVAASYKTACILSAVKMGEMADRDLALEVEKRDLVIHSDVGTTEGFQQFKHRMLPLTAREHAIYGEKQVYMDSAEYKNACGPND
jgi:hypothetical protein